MRTLLGCQAVLAALIAFGPTVDDANRVAGLLSVLVSLLISGAIMSIATRREAKLGLLALTTVAITLIAYRNADPAGIRSPLAALGTPLMAKDAATALLPPHLLGLAVGAPTVFLAAIVFQRQHPLWLRAIWMLGAVLGGLALLLSDSRDAWVAAAASCAVLVCTAFLRGRRAILVAAIVVSVVAGLVVVGTLGDDVSLKQREHLWRIGLAHVAANPLTGVGYGGLAALFAREAPGIGTNAHSLVVQVLGDFGLLGLAALVAAVVGSLRAAVSDPRSSATAFRGFIASIVFVLVAGMAESIIDATQRFPRGDVTIVLPLLFAVLAVPLSRRPAPSRALLRSS